MAKARSCILQSSKATHSLNTTDNLERSASSHDSKDASAEMETSNSTNQDDFSEESLLLPRTHNDSEISESDDDINFTQEDAPSHYTNYVCCKDLYDVC